LTIWFINIKYTKEYVNAAYKKLHSSHSSQHMGGKRRTVEFTHFLAYLGRLYQKRKKSGLLLHFLGGDRKYFSLCFTS
jgi:hypothetical protein